MYDAAMSFVTIYTDGGARGNPGPAAAGAVATENDAVVFEFKKYLGDHLTNNYAEYEAVALTLQELKQRNLTDRELRINMDSMLVVEQLSGRWKIKEPTLKEQAMKVHALLALFPSWKFTYVPRAQNKEADRLVNEALDEAQS